MLPARPEIGVLPARPEIGVLPARPELAVLPARPEKGVLPARPEIAVLLFQQDITQKQWLANMAVLLSVFGIRQKNGTKCAVLKPDVGMAVMAS